MILKFWTDMPGQTVQTQSSLIRGYTVCHSIYILWTNHSTVEPRATENRFFAGPDRFLVCKTDSVCIKRIFFGPKKTHFADYILAQLPGLVKCQTVNCP